MQKRAHLIDLITMEVVGNYLLSIAEEIGIALIKAAFSPNIKERRDCSAALLDHKGRTIAQAAHIPMHLGSIFGAGEALLGKYKKEGIEDGDVFIGNDGYYSGGTHLPDITVITPLFYEGTVVAFAGNIGHHLDVGGRTPGSTAADNKSIYEEGIRVPPVKLVKKGVLQRDLLDLITVNCRDPVERRADIEVQIAANEIGKQRISSLFEKYGSETILSVYNGLYEYSERRIRSAIKELKDGEYEFTTILDDDGTGKEANIRVMCTVKGDRLTIDFTGTSKQSEGAVNVTRTALLSTVYYAIQSLLDPDILQNYGFQRWIKIITEPGSIVDPGPTAAISCRTDTCQKIASTIFGSLMQALRTGRVIAGSNDNVSTIIFSGYNSRKNKDFVHLETVGGGSGARSTKDGLDGVQVHITNTSNLPVESLEVEYPLLVEKYAFVQDSGGLGKYRGGLALQRDIRILNDGTTFCAKADTFRNPPWGIFGGKQGSLLKILLNPGTENEATLSSKGQQYRLKKGDLVNVRTPGAGGFGDPRERDPELILEDLRNEKISLKEAMNSYGFNPKNYGGH